MAQLSSGPVAASPDSKHDTAILARLERVEAQLATFQELFRQLGIEPPPPRPVLRLIRGGAA